MPSLTRTLPLLVAFAFGALGVAIYYIPHAGAQEVEREMALWLRIVSAFAYFLGLASLMRLHWERIRRRDAGWGFSLVVYVGFGAMLFFVLYNDGLGPLHSQAEGGGYRWLFRSVHVPCAATMFSILAFYVASAAYRTFRARTSEAAILLVAAVIVMLGRVPIGRAISEAIPQVSDWLMEVPNLAAKRGVLLGISLGAIATALRILFGVERSYLGREE
ncbi:MAG: hypothetical protein AB1505_16685 [Candidatus Latescibacterota bacterium]